MRPLYAIVGVAVLGVGFASWAALGQAQSSAKDPPPPAPPPVEIPDLKPPSPPPTGIRPIPKTRPADELFDVPTANPRVLPSDAGPVPALDKVEIPELPGARRPVRPAVVEESSPTGVKPTVFIPGRDPDVAPIKLAPVSPPVVGQLSFQEPAVRLEWHGSPTLQVGAPAEYTLVARNTSSIPLHKVIVQVKVPTGAKVSGTEPKAEGSGSVLMWDLGTMAARQDKAVKISLIPADKGDLQCQAWVTITGSTSFKAEVREAKLAIATKAPLKVSAGEPVAISFVITNPGDHPAEGVKLTLVVPPGLEIKANGASPFDLGKLSPGESREVKVPAVARKSGVHKLDATVEGLGGIQAKASMTITAIKAQLDIAFTGPKLRYVDRKAVYSIKMTNNGDAPANEVVVAHQLPTGFKFVAADAGGKMDANSRTIVWTVGDMPVGEARELKCELLAAATGSFSHKVTATGDRGLQSEATLATKVEGLSAMAMEITDSDDPVEVATDTTYEIRVSNTGSKDETDVKLICAIPAQMKFKSARGPGKYELTANELIFEPLDKLPARTEVTYRITLTAKEKGDAKFKATMTASGLTEPIIRQESTKIYAD